MNKINKISCSYRKRLSLSCLALWLSCVAGYALGNPYSLTYSGRLTASKINDGAVTTEKLADGGVALAKIATCSNGKELKMVGGVWTCVYEVITKSITMKKCNANVCLNAAPALSH